MRMPRFADAAGHEFEVVTGSSGESSARCRRCGATNPDWPCRSSADGVDGLKLLGLLEGISDRVYVERFEGALVLATEQSTVAIEPPEGVFALVESRTGAIARLVWWDVAGVENHVPAFAIRRVWRRERPPRAFRCDVDESAGLAEDA